MHHCETAERIWGYALPTINTTRNSAVSNISNAYLNFLKPLKINGHQGLSVQIINPNLDQIGKIKSPKMP